MTPFKIVIPARYASSRLPGKPLLPIAGKPMIAHVCLQALKAKAAEVVVATDDERIAQVAEQTGVKALLTSAEHSSGTERIEEVASLLDWHEDDIVVNWQGDEPLLSSELVRCLAQSLAGNDDATVATLAAPATEQEIFSPHAVKVVLDHADYALYFSRAPIPWHRDAFTDAQPQVHTDHYWRHIGVYAYRVGLLHRYVQWHTAPLEQLESLEQLRILWHGERIVVVTVAHAPEAGVDTHEDLKRVEALLQGEEPVATQRGAT